MSSSTAPNVTEVQNRSPAPKAAATGQGSATESKDAAPSTKPSTTAPKKGLFVHRTDADVWRTFALFSTAILAAPLLAFYGAKDTLLGGNVTYAGLLAAIVVNVVLIGYIVVCFMEHDGGDVPPVEPVVPVEKDDQVKDKSI